MKWTKKAKNGKKWAFLSGMCINKGFLVIGFWLLVISYQGMPMNGERKCKLWFFRCVRMMKNGMSGIS